MCQAYEAEARFVTWLERQSGRCANGHLRFSDGLCYQGKLCATNDAYFAEKARPEPQGRG